MTTKHPLSRARTAGAMISALALLLVFAPPLFAQTPEPQKPDSPAADSQQLKERLLLLEETVKQLKSQIESIEETKRTDVATGEKISSTGTTPVTPAKPQDKGPGETTFTIYGFAMLDAGYQFKQNDPNWFDVVRPTKLPSFSNEFAPNGNTYFGVRQSRLGVKSSTPTKYGELKTIFEFELFGTGADAGQTTFRLRHAYGELGQFGGGQYNSVFMDGDIFPNTIEYWGPNGMVLFRNVQFRWMPFKGRNALTIAVERPGASNDQGRFADRIELQGVRGHFNLPDLTANVRFTRDWGHFQAAGILRRMAWVDTNNDAFDLGGSAVGAGLNLTSVLNFGENTKGKFGFVFGQGIQNYMNDADVDVGIQTNLAAGDPRRPIVGKALPMFGITAYLDHNWSKRWSSSMGYSILDVDNSNGQAPDGYRQGHYASANLLYYPVASALVGGEFIWGRRANFLDGFRADDFRVQFAFKYNFSKELKF